MDALSVGRPEIAAPKVMESGDATDGVRHTGYVKVFYPTAADPMKGFGFIYGGGSKSDAKGKKGKKGGQTEVYFRSNDVHESVLHSRHQGDPLLSPGEEVEYYITAVTARGPLAACVTLAGYTGALPPSPGLLPENEYKGPDAAHDEKHIGTVLPTICVSCL